MATFDPQPAAETLAAAYRSGELLKELAEVERPRTLVEGYDVQDRLIQHLEAEAVGWKLGVGSTKLKSQSGVGRSIAGRILRNELHPSDATVLLPNAAPVTVEFEVVFEIGHDVNPDGPATISRDVIGRTLVAFELVLSRFVDRRAVGWPSFAADNAGFQALILGAEVSPERLPDLLRTLTVTVDGSEKARAATGDDVTDPYDALDDLLAITRERGIVLPKGALVSTGSASFPFNFAAPQAEVAANFLEQQLRFYTRVGRGSHSEAMG